MNYSWIDQHVKKQSGHGMSTFNRSSVQVGKVLGALIDFVIGIA